MVRDGRRKIAGLAESTTQIAGGLTGALRIFAFFLALNEVRRGQKAFSLVVRAARLEEPRGVDRAGSCANGRSEGK